MISEAVSQEELRQLSNPPARAELPWNFPKVIDSSEGARRVAGELDDALALHGESLGTIGQIFVAYPQKDREVFPAAVNRGADAAAYFIDKMQSFAPRVKWVSLSSLVELRDLGRSENQSILHALTEPQHYRVCAPVSEDRFPFRKQKPAFVVMCDWNVEQGTTLANLYSYLSHNGAKVFAASVPQIWSNQRLYLPQNRSRQDNAALPALSNVFGAAAARNNGRLPELAYAFGQSARRDGVSLSVNEALEYFDAALKPHGHSPFTLTDGECRRLLAGLSTGSLTFNGLLQDLKSKTPVPRQPAPGV